MKKAKNFPIREAFSLFNLEITLFWDWLNRKDWEHLFGVQLKSNAPYAEFVEKIHLHQSRIKNQIEAIIIIIPVIKSFELNYTKPIQVEVFQLIKNKPYRYHRLNIKLIQKKRRRVNS